MASQKSDLPRCSGYGQCPTYSMYASAWTTPLRPGISHRSLPCISDVYAEPHSECDGLVTSSSVVNVTGAENSLLVYILTGWLTIGLSDHNGGSALGVADSESALTCAGVPDRRETPIAAYPCGQARPCKEVSEGSVRLLQGLPPGRSAQAVTGRRPVRPQTRRFFSHALLPACARADRVQRSPPGRRAAAGG